MRVQRDDVMVSAEEKLIEFEDEDERGAPCGRDGRWIGQSGWSWH